MKIGRRPFLQSAVATAFSEFAARAGGETHREPAWTTTWNAALEIIFRNISAVPNFDQPVRYEGAVYRGIWQECGPHESLAYALLAHYVTPAAGKPSITQDMRKLKSDRL